MTKLLKNDKTLSNESILFRAVQLRRKLDYHNTKYYNEDSPVISDVEYDEMLQELMSLENEFDFLKDKASPTMRVGGIPNKNFKPHKHLANMYSLDNGFNDEDIKRFLSRIEENNFDLEFLAEPKFDGLAISLTYEKGILVKAATRGDGIVGEDVTDNARTIKSIPLMLIADMPPDLLEVRCEVIMYKSVFEALNDKQRELGEKEYVNTRNAAAGALRQLDPKETASRKLNVFSYGVGHSVGFGNFATQLEIMEKLKEYGLPVYTENNNFSVVLGLVGIKSYCDQLVKNRDSLRFGIDGAVFKLNNINNQHKMGWHTKAPKFALAYKFPAEERTTKVIDIISQIGRSGALYPVAILEPVFVGGVTVSRATLHNISEIHKKDVRVGDTVVVRRAGDVVPELVMVIKELRLKDAAMFEFPKTCPSCHTATQTTDDGKTTSCVNYACPGQLKRFLEHFVKRDAMDIENVGPGLIEKLVDLGLVKSTVDLFNLSIPMLMECEGIQQKGAEKIYNSIQSKLRVPLDRFLYSFGADGVGRTTSKKLADKYKNLNAVMNATPQDLITMFDSDAVVLVKKIDEFINSNKTKELIKAFLGLNLVTYHNSVSIENFILEGKQFVLSGSFGSLSKSDLEKQIIAYGGKIASGISAKSNLYLIAGEGSGAKSIKAKELNVPILSLDDFADMLSSKNL